MPTDSPAALADKIQSCADIPDGVPWSQEELDLIEAALRAYSPPRRVADEQLGAHFWPPCDPQLISLAKRACFTSDTAYRNYLLRCDIPPARRLLELFDMHRKEAVRSTLTLPSEPTRAMLAAWSDVMRGIGRHRPSTAWPGLHYSDSESLMVDAYRAMLHAAPAYGGASCEAERLELEHLGDPEKKTAIYTATWETQAPSSDTARLDWLATMLVEVHRCVRWGSRQLIYAQPDPVEGADDEPSDIRAQIDREIARGKK